MKKKETECCKNCKYGKYYEKDWLTTLGRYKDFCFCCKHPPKISTKVDWAQFPMTGPSWWCGEWKRKIEKKQ